jgi:hypothetical protein
MHQELDRQRPRLPRELPEDWREFLKFASGSFRTEFLVDLEPRHMPEDRAVIFEQLESIPVLLRSSWTAFNSIVTSLEKT